MDNYSSDVLQRPEIGDFSILMNSQCVDCKFKELHLEESAAKVNFTDTVKVYKITCAHANVCKYFVTKS